MPLSTLPTAVGMAARLGIVLMRVKRGFAGQELDDPPGGGCGWIAGLSNRATVHGCRPVKPLNGAYVADAM